MEKNIERLRKVSSEIMLLKHTIAMLGWDQETYMPPAAIEERSEQLSLMESLLHQKSTDPEIGELLSLLGADEKNLFGDSSLPQFDRALLRTFYRDYTKNTKLPTELVSKIAGQTSIAQNVWVKARSESNYPLFAPELEKLLALIKEKADCLGFEDHPYDALLDEFEPEMKTADVKKVFEDVRGTLSDLVQRIAKAHQVDDAVLRLNYPLPKQEAFGRLVLEDMGFDMSRGRLDKSAHPFTTTLGRDDVRLTARYKEDYFAPGLFGIIHEGGHGLYELGYSEDIRGTLLADAASLGIHESQSRTWENIIARSYPFWQHYFPLLQKYFPENLENVEVDTFYRAINKVEPSHIRIDADEVTYSLHIILRFELETELISGRLQVDDVPEAWRNLSNELLGIVPEKDADGVLQDIHWSMGGIGYFPTYALGNFYSAQFFKAMKNRRGMVEQEIGEGKLEGVLAWLRDNIHQYGRALTAEQLCKQVTGEPLNPSYYIEYIRSKYSMIYEL